MAFTPTPGADAARDPPRTSRNRAWCCELLAQAKALWDENALSAGQMAAKLGISKNALLGKVHRLGWPTHKQAPRQRKPVPKVKPLPPVIPVLEEAPPAVPKFLGLSLYNLRASSCRFPQGESAPYSFCGQRKRDGSSYCPYHHRIVYLAISARRPLHIPEPWADYRGRK